MLNPLSKQWQAVAYRYFIFTVIVTDLLLFISSTDPPAARSHGIFVGATDCVVSGIFLLEYVARLVTVTERVKYGKRGALMDRLGYGVCVRDVCRVDRFTGDGALLCGVGHGPGAAQADGSPHVPTLSHFENSILHSRHGCSLPRHLPQCGNSTGLSPRLCRFDAVNGCAAVPAATQER